MCLQYKSFENTMEKGEIACNEQFLLFPQCVFYQFEELSSILIKFEIVVCNLFQFGRVESFSFGKGLRAIKALAVTEDKLYVTQIMKFNYEKVKRLLEDKTKVVSSIFCFL